MKKISFEKMHGAGNDFIFIHKNKNPEFVLSKSKVAALCNRRTGIGADGIITISNSDEYDFEMEYFNADGSTGSLCGNGARCAILFADNYKLIDKIAEKFLSNGKIYSGKVIDTNKIKFNFNPPGKINLDISIEAGGQKIKAAYLDTGSPHVVINIENILIEPFKKNEYYYNINNVPVLALGREIRYHKNFEPEGVNVNFIKTVNDGLLIRTYERGVEDETLACGTGAVAAALTGFNFGIEQPIKIFTKGGDELVVDFAIENDEVKNLSLNGPAEFVFSGQISI